VVYVTLNVSFKLEEIHRTEVKVTDATWVEIQNHQENNWHISLTARSAFVKCQLYSILCSRWYDAHHFKLRCLMR
jgi:hypothetical protein